MIQAMAHLSIGAFAVLGLEETGARAVAECADGGVSSIHVVPAYPRQTSVTFLQPSDRFDGAND